MGTVTTDGCRKGTERRPVRWNVINWQLLHSCWKNRTLSMAWNWWMTLKVTEGHRKWLWLAVNQFLLVVCINNFCTLHHFRDIITDIEDTYQTWNWVIGSIGSSFTSGSPGHHYDPVWDPSFSSFRKMPNMQNVHFKCWNDESHCQVSAVGLKSLDVSPCNELLLLHMIIKNSSA